MGFQAFSNKKYVWMTADYTVRKGKPVVFIFARGEDGERAIFQSEIRPYFYAPAQEALQIIDPDIEVGDTFEAIDRKKVKQIFTRLPRDVPIKAQKFSRAYEDKLAFPLRYLIDKGIRNSFTVRTEGRKRRIEPLDEDLPQIKPVVCYLDIENETEKGAIIDPDEAKYMTLCIGLSFSDEPKDHFMCLKATNEEEERQMYSDLIKVLNDRQPDIITGWNIYYDIATIVNRMIRLKMDPGRLSPMGFTEVKERHARMKISGLNVVDMMDLFQKFFQGKTYDSYRLEYLADKILDVPEDHFDYDNKMNRHHVDEVIPYNKRDVVDRLRALSEHFHLIDLFDGLRRTAGCRFEDVIFTSMYTDVSMLREYNGIYVLGTKGKDDAGIEYEGAFVGQPPTGVYEDVVALDFAGMYPNIIIAYNLSPETLTPAEWVEDESKYHVFDFGRGDKVYFRKEPMGIVPRTIQKFLNYRAHIKQTKNQLDKSDPLYDILDLSEYGIKQAIAAIYGTFAFRGSRLYYPDIARCVTWAGRRLVTECKKYIESMGYSFLYADTDSLYILIDEGDKIEIGEKIEFELNKLLVKMAEEEGSMRPAKIEFEQAFDTILFKGAKKRYAGHCTFWKGKPTDQIIIKGFETKRSDSALITREVQAEVLDKILHKRPEEEIRAYIKPIVEQLPHMPFSEIGMPKRIRKPLDQYPPGMVRGLVFAEEFMGKKFEPGDRPLIFQLKRMKDGYPPRVSVTMTNKKGKERVEFKEIKWVPLSGSAELEEWFNCIDWKMQTYKIIERKLEEILEAFGLSMSEIMTDQKQMTLAGF